MSALSMFSSKALKKKINKHTSQNACMFSAHLGRIGKTAFHRCQDPLIYCEVHDVIPQTPTSDTKKSTWPPVNYRWKRWHLQACRVRADAQSLRHPSPVTAGHIWLLRSIPPLSHYIFKPWNVFSAGVNDQARMNQWGTAKAISHGILLTHITWTG